jgi:hypothetical protein
MKGSEAQQKFSFPASSCILMHTSKNGFGLKVQLLTIEAVLTFSAKQPYSQGL